MSFKPNKSQLVCSLDVFKQQASATSNNWDDPIQKRFYEEFVSPISHKFYAYIAELDKLDNHFESAERQINGLIEYSE